MQLERPLVPLEVALIGAGARSTTIYEPLFQSLQPWIKLVAVCDPVREHGAALAERLGVAAFHDIRELVRARPMEAALVVTPAASHHSLSVFLSSHGIHNLVETPWSTLLVQARQMMETARENNVVARVAENFLRFPIDRMAQKLMDGSIVSPINRIVSYGDHTGYHNNSRWIRFARSHPVWVQSVRHAMPTTAFTAWPQRHYQSEEYQANFFMFPDNFFVMDHLANVKGFLGRQPRPGHTEWHGPRGAIVYAAKAPWRGAGEVRYCSDAAIESGGGCADQVFPIVNEFENRRWTRTYADLPTGRVEHINPFRPVQMVQHIWDEYGSCVMDHIVDFALQVRGLRDSEFSAEDALMSQMMESGARESSLREGRRLALPLQGDIEADALERDRQRRQLGVDPLDIEAMLDISYPR